MKHLGGLTVLMLAACALARAAGGEPDRITFPHDLHFENEVECTTCHPDVAGSARATDRLRPDMDVCADCHDIEDDTGCAVCHANVDEAAPHSGPAASAMRPTSRGA